MTHQAVIVYDTPLEDISKQIMIAIIIFPPPLRRFLPDGGLLPVAMDGDWTAIGSFVHI
jgi:hypothetical protein